MKIFAIPSLGFLVVARLLDEDRGIALTWSVVALGDDVKNEPMAACRRSGHRWPAVHCSDTLFCVAKVAARSTRTRARADYGIVRVPRGDMYIPQHFAALTRSRTLHGQSARLLDACAPAVA